MFLRIILAGFHHWGRIDKAVGHEVSPPAAWMPNYSQFLRKVVEDIVD